MKKIYLAALASALILGSAACSDKSSKSEVEGAEATEQTETSKVNELIDMLNEMNAKLRGAKNPAEANKIMVKYNSKLNKYARSKEAITPEQREELTDAFVATVSNMANLSASREGVDLEDADVKAALDEQLAMVKDKFNNATANTKTLGEYILKANKAMK